jgi:hypothetical protein
MARIRTIKPEFWEDEKISKLPFACRLFYIGTWNFSDDYGVFRGNASVLKSKIFPYDESLRVSEIQKWLDTLAEARRIIPISYNSESYYWICAFQSHQVIDKRYQKSLLPQNVLNELIKNYTTCLHSDHIVDTPQEMEMEMEMEKEINPSTQKRESSDKPDFIEKVIKSFSEKYQEIRGLEYFVSNKGAERSCAGKLLTMYKKKNPISNSEKTLFDLEIFFERCLLITDPWLSQNMSLPMVLSKMNQILNILQDGNNKRKTQPATSDAELAGVIAKHFATDYPKG